MDTAAPVEAPAPLSTIEDMESSDSSVADEYIKLLPEALRVTFASNMRTMLMAAIVRERRRCLSVVGRGISYHMRQIETLEPAIIAALSGNDEQTAKQLGNQRAIEVKSASVLRSIGMAVRASPGACSNCGGASVVPSAIVAGALVPCGTCQPPPPDHETPA